MKRSIQLFLTVIAFALSGGAAMELHDHVGTLTPWAVPIAWVLQIFLPATTMIWTYPVIFVPTFPVGVAVAISICAAIARYNDMEPSEVVEWGELAGIMIVYWISWYHLWTSRVSRCQEGGKKPL